MKTALFHLKFMLEPRMPPGAPRSPPGAPQGIPREPQRAPETLAQIALHRLHCIDCTA